MQKTTRLLWQSQLLLTPPADRHFYRVLLRQKKDMIGITISSIDAEKRQYRDTEMNETWIPIEKFSKEYGEILQLALLEITKEEACASSFV